MISIGALSGLGAGLTALGEKIIVPTAAAIGAAGCRYLTDKIFDGIDSIGDSYFCNNYRRTENRNNYYPEIPRTISERAEQAPPIVKEFIEDTIEYNEPSCKVNHIELLPYQVIENGVVKNRILMDYDDYVKMTRK